MLSVFSQCQLGEGNIRKISKKNKDEPSKWNIKITNRTVSYYQHYLTTLFLASILFLLPAPSKTILPSPFLNLAQSRENFLTKKTVLHHAHL
jgi:hypothetical protein